MTTKPSDMKPSERIFAGLPTWGECGDWEQWETIRRIAAYLDEQHAVGRGPELSLCPGIGGHACSQCCDKPLPVATPPAQPVVAELFKCGACGLPVHHNGGNCAYRHGALGTIHLTGSEPVAKPPRTDRYQEDLASRFAAGESAASLQLAYGIDDGDLMRSLRDVLRRLLGEAEQETVVPAVPVAGEPTLADDLQSIRWGGMNPESSFYETHIEAAYKRVVAAALGRDAALAQVEQLTRQIAAHEEICSGADDDKPGEVDRLNPYKRSWVKQEIPTDPLASFIRGIRYYAGMLEDDDNWSHGLGHIEELCVEFDRAIQARSGSSYVSPREAVTAANALLEQERAHSAALRAEISANAEMVAAAESLVQSRARHQKETNDLISAATEQSDRIKQLERELAQAVAHHEDLKSTPEAESPPVVTGERPIVVGSTWQFHADRLHGPGSDHLSGPREVDWFDADTVHTRFLDNSAGTAWDHVSFRELHEWLSDPPTPATGGEGETK